MTAERCHCPACSPLLHATIHADKHCDSMQVLVPPRMVQDVTERLARAGFTVVKFDDDRWIARVFDEFPKLEK